MARASEPRSRQASKLHFGRLPWVKVMALATFLKSRNVSFYVVSNRWLISQKLPGLFLWVRGRLEPPVNVQRRPLRRRCCSWRSPPQRWRQTHAKNQVQWCPLDKNKRKGFQPSVVNKSLTNLGITNTHRIDLAIRNWSCDVICPMYCLTSLKIVAEL